jgi:hypothetical protein
MVSQMYFMDISNKTFLTTIIILLYMTDLWWHYHQYVNTKRDKLLQFIKIV